MKRLERLTGLLSFLQSRSYTKVNEIEQKFQVSERTVFRDIKSLEEAGVPLSFEKNKGYFILDRHFLPPLSLTLAEAKSFVFVEQLASKYIDEETFLHFSNALQKIKSKLRDSQLEDFESLQSKVSAYIDLDFTPKYLQIVEQACTDKKVLELIYRDVNNNETSRLIEPIGITFYNQAWHIIAYCQLRNDYRDFSLGRVVELNTSSDTYTRKHFTLSEYIKKIENDDSD